MVLNLPATLKIYNNKLMSMNDGLTKRFRTTEYFMWFMFGKTGKFSKKRNTRHSFTKEMYG